jgi:hypothetical protein
MKFSIVFGTDGIMQAITILVEASKTAISDQEPNTNFDSIDN